MKFTNPKRLVLELQLRLVEETFKELVHSGTLNCLVDPVFVRNHSLLTRTIKPLPISLIDGTVNHHII